MKYIKSSFRMLAAGLAGFAFTAAASAQNYGGGKQGGQSALPAPAEQGKNVTGFSVTTMDGNPYGWFGPGSTGGVATPWASQYGAWISPPASYWLSDRIARQQAYTQRYFQSQDYEMRRLAVRRAQIDQMLYEKANVPPPEAVREEARLQRLTRARNTPPLEEIASGASLNELLTNIQRVSARDRIPGYTIAVDPEALRHINVTTTEDARGSNEMFKPNTLKEWPVALAPTRFDADKDLVRNAVSAMAAAQEQGKVDEARLVAARRAIDRMRDNLYQARFDIAFADYTRAVEFLNKVEDAVIVLGRPGAQNYLNGTFAARGKTMAELTDYMISKGLKFAKASPGDEPHYSSLYQQLATYELSLSRNANQMSTTERTALKDR